MRMAPASCQTKDLVEAVVKRMQHPDSKYLLAETSQENK